jgi:hypothetical protein
MARNAGLTAAADGQDGTADVGGLGRGREQAGGGYVIRRGHPRSGTVAAMAGRFGHL